MEKQDEEVSHPLANVTTASRLRTSGALTMVGSAVRVVGAILTDFGSFVGLPAIGSLGNAPSAGSSLGLLFCPSDCAPAAWVTQGRSRIWQRHHC